MKKDDKIRVLHVIGGGGYGGRERMLHLLLREEKKDPQLFSEVYFLKPTGVFYDKIKTEGIGTHWYDPSEKWSWLSSGVKLFEDYDLLVYHTTHWRILLIGILSGRPIVYRLSGVYLTIKKTFRDVAVILFKRAYNLLFGIRISNNSKSLKLYGQDGEQPNNVLPNKRSGIRLIRRWQFIAFLNLFCDKIIVNSRYALKSLTSKYYVPANNSQIVLIPNGINTDIELPSGDRIRKEFNIAKEFFVIGTVCRFDVRKRIDRLLKGFAELASDPRMMLLIVGGGDDILEKGFKDYVEKKNISSKVIFTGYRSDTLDCIDAMDLFVLPSDNESFSNVLLEAMILAKPCVVFADSGGPEEIIGSKPGIGYIIKHYSGIVQIVMTLMNDRSEGQLIGRNAFRFIQDEYTLEQYQTRYKMLYLDTIN